MLSPADPPGPPAFIDPPFALGDAFDAIPAHISQWTSGTSTVVDIDPTFGTSWLLQWGIGDDATNLNVVGVTTTVRSVTIERAVADVRLELRPDETGGEPVLVWNHPGVLDPSAGLQPAEMSPIARKRLGDRLAAANAADPPPPTLTLPLRLTAVTGGPVGVSGTELVVDYAASAVAPGTTLTMRGDPQPLGLSVPAGLRPDRGTWSIDARHLGRELNGPSRAPGPRRRSGRRGLGRPLGRRGAAGHGDVRRRRGGAGRRHRRRRRRRPRRARRRGSCRRPRPARRGPGQRGDPARRRSPRRAGAAARPPAGGGRRGRRVGGRPDHHRDGALVRRPRRRADRPSRPSPVRPCG